VPGLQNARAGSRFRVDGRELEFHEWAQK
jgi:hypothetical protein